MSLPSVPSDCYFAQLLQVSRDALPVFKPESLTLSLNVLTSFEEKSQSFPKGASGWSPRYLQLIWFTTKETVSYRAQLGLAEER